MSHSAEERMNNLEAALRLFMSEIDGRSIREYLFSPGGPSYENIYPTTWDELIRRRWIDDALAPHWCRLTGSGWLIGIQLLDLQDDDVFRNKMAKLAATLKGYVKGRHSDALPLMS